MGAQGVNDEETPAVYGMQRWWPSSRSGRRGGVGIPDFIEDGHAVARQAPADRRVEEALGRRGEGIGHEFRHQQFGHVTQFANPTRGPRLVYASGRTEPRTELLTVEARLAFDETASDGPDDGEDEGVSTNRARSLSGLLAGADALPRPRIERLHGPLPLERQNPASLVRQGSGVLLLAGVPGLEPRLTGPEPVGLPITPYPKG